MEYVRDFRWERGLSVERFTSHLSKVGFQSVNLGRACEIVAKMKREGAKIYLTFTSNMVTSGLRGFFAQLIELGMVDIVVTTVGGLEEDIMRAHNERFAIGSFRADDVALHERGMNRVGNILIRDESYANFEDTITGMLKKIYEKRKRMTSAEFFREVGLLIQDKNSILHQAAVKNVPIFCPAITDGALGFHLFMFQEKHPDFVIDCVRDFKDIVTFTSQDDKKGIICLGGGVSKHYAILSTLISGGMDYAVYMTTATPYSGSMSGASTDEAKSWGKIKDDADAVTVIGDVSITFPLMMCSVLERLSEEGLIRGA
ncbi:MAG: deoxyhypusine synthase family protein [Candidatus Woesearchaeota archaeon]